jgi:hypothetical protein
MVLYIMDFLFDEPNKYLFIAASIVSQRACSLTLLWLGSIQDQVCGDALYDPHTIGKEVGFVSSFGRFKLNIIIVGQKTSNLKMKVLFTFWVDVITTYINNTSLKFRLIWF